MKTKSSNLILASLAACLFIVVGCAPAEKKPETKKNFLDANLYVLNINAATFKNMPDTADIVFSFKLDGKQKLTLGGWIKPANNSGRFGDVPNLDLNVGTRTVGIINTGTYFNNIILDIPTIKAIKQELALPKKNFVIFTPEYLTGLPNIGYIITSAENIDELPNTAALRMNPSPPKKYD